VLLVVIGALAAISVVVAALVIFSSGEGPAERPEPAAAVRAGEQSVVVGRGTAPTQVVVLEDYASPESRAFEIASRDFLRIEAARGSVQVEYRPFATGAGYSRDAFLAWAGVLRAGTPDQALAFHDVLFDRQPDDASAEPPTPRQLVTWAKDVGVRDDAVFAAMATDDEELVAHAARAAREAGADRTPLVLLDGEPVTAETPTGLADALQRAILRQER
jgi:protein-disulfide isomerase